MEVKTITGTEAIQRMRALRHSDSQFFTMHHLTWDNSKRDSNGLRTVENCQLRRALPGERFFPNEDLYLPYVDKDINEPRNCYKKLIRLVAFPPKFELMKVNWFND